MYRKLKDFLVVLVAWIVFLALFNATLRTLYVVPVGENVRTLGHCETPWKLDEGELMVAGDHAYLPYELQGLAIINVSDKKNPELVGEYDTPADVTALALDGHLLYVGVRDTGLVVVNVSDVRNPRELGSYNISSPYDISLSGTLAYVAAGYQGLLILNISNPSNITETGRYLQEWPEAPISALGIELEGEYAYIRERDRVSIIDVSNSSDPVKVGEFDSNNVYDFAVVGDLCYVIDARYLHVFNLSLKEYPALVNSYQLPEGASPHRLELAGDHAYIVTGWRGLFILNITDERNIRELGHYEGARELYSFWSGWGGGLGVEGEYIFIADDYEGLYILTSEEGHTPHDTIFYKLFPCFILGILVASGLTGVFLAREKLAQRLGKAPRNLRGF